jgi:hypothetical protein
MKGTSAMSQDRAFQISSGGATLVLVMPTLADTPSGSSIASALERAAAALRSGAPDSRLEAAHGTEAALMRRVEAEVYGTD